MDFSKLCYAPLYLQLVLDIALWPLLLSSIYYFKMVCQNFGQVPSEQLVHYIVSECI